MVQSDSNIDIDIDIDIDIPREMSASFSTNSSRISLVHSNVSSISYYKRMEIQSNKLTWDKKVEISEKENLLLLYATLKVREEEMTNKVIDKNSKQYANNKVSILNNMLKL